MNINAYVVYFDFYSCKKDNFQMNYCNILLIFAQNTDCGYSLDRAALIGTHNLCFRAKRLMHSP